MTENPMMLYAQSLDRIGKLETLARTAKLKTHEERAAAMFLMAFRHNADNYSFIKNNAGIHHLVEISEANSLQNLFEILWNSPIFELPVPDSFHSMTVLFQAWNMYLKHLNPDEFIRQCVIWLSQRDFGDAEPKINSTERAFLVERFEVEI